MCITDHTCPKKAFEIYTGELDMTRNRFINDPTFNTLQDRITGIHFKRSVNLIIIEIYNFLKNNLIFFAICCQADLYDSSKAEVLGRIQTSALVDWETNNNWSWDDGHYLVIVWPVELPDHVNICPYGDYYDAFESSFAQGDVQGQRKFTVRIQFKFNLSFRNDGEPT